MKKLLSTKDVARLLGVNEKLVYSLITEKGLPATKIVGKWMFPEDLVEQWVESKTVNYPAPREQAEPQADLLIVAGSNDILLDRTLELFMVLHPGRLAVFGNLGSLGGLKALRRQLCQIATSHLAEEDADEFNFSYAVDALSSVPAVVNFCRREQGFLLPRGNPLKISGLADAVKKQLRVVNRPLGTSTRLLFDRELSRVGADPEQVPGYDREVGRHLDVGLEILAGHADIGPAIRPVAGLLGLDFLPLHWERFDLIIPTAGFFHPGVQQFLDLLNQPAFHQLAEDLSGYDLRCSGRMMQRATA
jgi:putative molybdopterin biosynthesis protein